ncbi:MAG: DNA polymerase III subunit delta [Planctomycetota bacterium]
MAAPNPERELDRLRKLCKGPLPAVLVIAGASKFFRGEAIDLVLGAVPKDADLRSIDGTADSDGRELDDLQGGGLFGSGSYVCVKRAAGWLKTFQKELERRIDHIADGCGLILEVEKLDKRTKLAKALMARGEALELRDLYAEPFGRGRGPMDSEVVQFLIRRGRQRKLDFTPEAAILIRATVGDDPTELQAELDRLELQFPNGGSVGPEELRGKLRIAFESTPFEFAEAVLVFDRKRAERSLEAMFERGVKARDGSSMDAGGVFPMVTSWLFQSMTNVLHGVRLRDQGVSDRDIPSRCGVRFFTERFEAQVRVNQAPRLARGVELLVDAQRKFRSSGETPRLILADFLARYFGSAVPA